LIVTGFGPQENRMTPPARTAATTALEVQLAAVPFPMTRPSADPMQTNMNVAANAQTRTARGTKGRIERAYIPVESPAANAARISVTRGRLKHKNLLASVRQATLASVAAQE